MGSHPSPYLRSQRRTSRRASGLVTCPLRSIRHESADPALDRMRGGSMGRKHLNAEEIIGKLRSVEIELRLQLRGACGAAQVPRGSCPMTSRGVRQGPCCYAFHPRDVSGSGILDSRRVSAYVLADRDRLQALRAVNSVEGTLFFESDGRATRDSLLIDTPVV